MAEDKKALTLWDFYESNKQYFGGLFIDERPGGDTFAALVDMSDDERERFIRTLPEDFVAGFDLSLLPPAETDA